MGTVHAVTIEKKGTKMTPGIWGVIVFIHFFFLTTKLQCSEPFLMGFERETPPHPRFFAFLNFERSTN